MSEYLTDFDRLVEQQDQELAHDGVVSPFTHLQLQALAEGKPIPHAYTTPAVQQATARLLQGLKRSHLSSPPDDDDDALWFDYGEE